MRHPAIDFASLRCIPVLEGAGESPVHGRMQRRSATGRLDVSTGYLENVLVVPELRLQLAHDAIVPQEAVTYPWTLGFEVERSFRGKAASYEKPFDIEVSGDEICCLSNLYSRNFYHWVTEEVPRVVALEQTGFSGKYLVLDLPSFAVQFLALLGVAEDRIVTRINRPTLFHRAAYVSVIDVTHIKHFPDLYRDSRRLLLDAVAAVPGSFPRRIWLERITGVNNTGRDLANREEIFSILTRYGFEPVDMASLPVAQQIACASRAEILAGVHGAAFVHAMFLPEARGVVECYSPLFINPGILQISQLLHLDYSMLVYDIAYHGYRHGKKVMVNGDHLELVLQRLCSGGALY